MIVDGDWQAVEGVLTKVMATLGEYLQTWKLKLQTLEAEHHKNGVGGLPSQQQGN